MIALALALLVGASPLDAALALRLRCDMPFEAQFHQFDERCPSSLWCWDDDGRPDMGPDGRIFAAPGGFFNLHYTLEGSNAVPQTDLDGNGVPDYVDHFAVAFEDALAAFRRLGFRDPQEDAQGGDSRYDVYFSWAGGFGGATYWDEHSPNMRPDYPGGYPTFIAINPVQHAFADEVFPAWMGDLLIRQVAAHELHHAVQMGYGDGGASWVLEGMSVMMEQVVLDLPRHFPFVTDFRYVFRYAHPELTLLQPEVSQLGYANGLFYTSLLADMGGSPGGYTAYWDSIGRNAVREYWHPSAPTAEALVDGGLQAAGLGTLREAYRRFTLRSVFLGDHDDGQHMRDAYRYHGVHGALAATPLIDPGTYTTPRLERFGYAVFRLEAPAKGPVTLVKPAAAQSEWDWVRQYPDCSTTVTALAPAQTAVTLAEDGRSLRSWLVVRHFGAWPRSYALTVTFATRPAPPVSQTLTILDAPQSASAGTYAPVIARLARSDCRVLDVSDRATWKVEPAGAARLTAGNAVESLRNGPVTLSAAYAGAATAVTWTITGGHERRVVYGGGGGCQAGGPMDWVLGVGVLLLLWQVVRRSANT